MITVTTATGKKFQSDYAVTLRSPPRGFIRIIGEDIGTLEKVFSDEKEMPIVGYEPYKEVSDIFEEDSGVKIILKP